MGYRDSSYYKQAISADMIMVEMWALSRQGKAVPCTWDTDAERQAFKEAYPALYMSIMYSDWLKPHSAKLSRVVCTKWA